MAQGRIRFRLTSDQYGLEYDGWHVDDIVVRAAEPAPEGLLFHAGFESGGTGAWSSVEP